MLIVMTKFILNELGESAHSNLIVLVCVVLDRLSFGTNHVWTRVLVFPCVWTSMWYINGYWGKSYWENI